MNAKEILEGAEKRILTNRTAEATLTFVDASSRPLAHARVKVRLARHEFKLGANAFGLLAEDAALRDAYRTLFAGLLNYATLPFYWGSYEPERGKKNEERLSEMAAWCAENRVTAKGHPLVWHEVFPKWAEKLPDNETLDLLRRRVIETVARFKGRIDIWDVVNEATVSQKFDNAVGRWMKQEGAAACVGAALGWAHRANPAATLLYNDFNVSPEMERLVEGLLEHCVPMNVLGIQSHMHKGVWPVERIWEVCETYAWFGLPLHFTEATVLSGRLKEKDDNDWHRKRDDWFTTPEGEREQAEYGAKFYTVLFSHPAVEAITWWDFSDAWAWQGAPAGLARKDMTPKPLYEWLATAFKKRWATDVRTVTDDSGRVPVRCYFGEHEVEAETESGARLKGTFYLRRLGERAITVAVK